MKHKLLNNILHKDNFIQIFPYLFLAIVFPFAKTATSIGVILITLGWVISGYWSYKKDRILQDPNILFLCSFFLIYLFSLIYTDNKPYGLGQLVKYLALIILPVVCGSSKFLTPTLRKRSLIAFVVSIFSATLFCLGYGLYRNFTITDVKTLPYSFEANFGVNAGPSFIHWDYFSYKELIDILNFHPTYFSLYLVVVIFYLIGLLDKNLLTSSRKRFWIYVLVFYFIFFLFLLSARIIIITFIFLLFLYLFRSFSHRFGSWKSLVITIVVVFISLGIIYALPITRYRLFNEMGLLKFSIPKPDEDPGTGLRMRLVHWQSSLDVIKRSPIFGAGVGDAQKALDNAYSNRGYYLYFGFNAHNQFLQTWMSTGLIGIFSLLLVFYISFKKAIQEKDEVYFCFLFVFFIASLTESLLQSQKGIVFFAFFNCLFFFASRKDGREISFSLDSKKFD